MHNRVDARVERGKTGMLLLVTAVVLVVVGVLVYDLYTSAMHHIQFVLDHSGSANSQPPG